MPHADPAEPLLNPRSTVQEEFAMPIALVQEIKFLFHDKDCREEAYTVHKLDAREQLCVWKRAEAGFADRCCTAANRL